MQVGKRPAACEDGGLGCPSDAPTSKFVTFGKSWLVLILRIDRVPSVGGRARNADCGQPCSILGPGGHGKGGCPPEWGCTCDSLPGLSCQLRVGPQSLLDLGVGGRSLVLTRDKWFLGGRSLELSRKAETNQHHFGHVSVIFHWPLKLKLKVTSGKEGKAVG